MFKISYKYKFNIYCNDVLLIAIDVFLIVSYMYIIETIEISLMYEHFNVLNVLKIIKI